MTGSIAKIELNIFKAASLRSLTQQQRLVAAVTLNHACKDFTGSEEDLSRHESTCSGSDFCSQPAKEI